MIHTANGSAMPIPNIEFVIILIFSSTVTDSSRKLIAVNTVQQISISELYSLRTSLYKNALSAM